MANVVLLTPIDGELLDTIKQAFHGATIVHIVRTLAELENLDIEIQDNAILIAFGTGVIVSSSLLRRFAGGAYNFHAAPPEFPGRDPHNFAVYNGVSEYGATVHRMTARVDEGPIVAVRRFPIEPKTSPSELLKKANHYLRILLIELAPKISAGERLPVISGEAWGGKKTTRRDFLSMCRISPDITREEFERRRRAFDDEKYDNLIIELHDQIFRIEKTRDADARPNNQWKDFTQNAYRKLLGSVKERGYRFAFFDKRPTDKHVLWRHDIDMSLERAMILAGIEAELGVKSTFFVNPHSIYYSILEPDSLAHFRDVLSKGHRLGLHFDADAYEFSKMASGVSRETLEQALSNERGLLENWLDTPIKAVSFHNPEAENLLRFDDLCLAGMVNTYAREIGENYLYGSDSNGYWRHGSLSDLVESADGKNLHILTHPVWWTKNPMAPRERVQTAVQRRADSVMRIYDEMMSRHGRKNISE